MNVVRTRRANRDMLSIYAFIAEHNAAAAERVAAAFNHRFAQLSALPYLGRERPEFGPGIRTLLSGNHLIFYRVGPERITVLRVIDGRMDVEAEFKR